jgi:hypothetical protein
VNGVPTEGNAYNRHTCAVYIDTGGGRVGSSSDANAGNPAIECGWQTGILFDRKSLDTANGAKAIGIDMTALDNPAPEGGTFSDRVDSAIALPSGLPITLSTNRKDAQIVFDRITGHLEFRNNGSQRFAANLTNGIIHSWDGVNGDANEWFMDLVGTAVPSALFNIRGSERLAADATAGAGEAVAPAGFLRILIDGVPYKLAYYHD